MALGGEPLTHEIIVYSKEGCHLCERAVAKLRQLISARDAVVIKTVEITQDARLLEKYAFDVPVVVLDERVILRASEIDSPGDIETKLEIELGSLYG